MNKLRRTLLLGFVLAALSTSSARAELSEQQVKSAYVFNFIKFVEWPAHEIKAGGKVTLCVIGDNALHATLAILENRKVGKYILHVHASTEPENLPTCHVLFIGEREHRRIVSIIKSAQAHHSLTISDIPDFAEHGGGIGLLMHNDRMLFEVNLAATRQAGLHLSGQMLNLASNIFGK